MSRNFTKVAAGIYKPTDTAAKVLGRARARTPTGSNGTHRCTSADRKLSPSL
jgi:hypothetical protein